MLRAHKCVQYVCALRMVVDELQRESFIRGMHRGHENDGGP